MFRSFSGPSVYSIVNLNRHHCGFLLPVLFTTYASSTPSRKLATMANTASLKHAEDFLDFVNASPTPFHAVRSAKLRLEKAGFNQIKVCSTFLSVIKSHHEYLTRSITGA